MQNPQYQPQVEQPRKNGISTPVGILIAVAVLCGSCAIIGGIGAILKKDKPAEVAQTNPVNSPTNTSANDAKQTTNKTSNQSPPAEVISNLKWSDYDNVYNTKSNSTDMQKESLWKNFEGRKVAWQGTVADVSKGMLGGLTLNIKMNSETLTSDVSLSLKKDQESKAINLTKGDKVSFTGKLKSYGGAMLPLSMDEGEVR